MVEGRENERVPPPGRRDAGLAARLLIYLRQIDLSSAPTTNEQTSSPTRIALRANKL